MKKKTQKNEPIFYFETYEYAPWIELKRVRWLGIKSTRLRKLTPAQNELELKVTRKTDLI